MVLTARHYALLGGVAIASGAGGAAIASMIDSAPAERYEAAEPVAEALVETDAPAWPPQDPPAEEQHPTEEAPTPEIETPPAPSLPELPPDAEDFRVRSGSAGGFLYLEHVIGVVEPDKPLPMVVVLHGRGSRAHLVGDPFRALPHPVRVIVPQARDVLGDGYQWLPVRVGEGLVERLSSSLFQVSNELAAFIRDMQNTYATAGKPIVSGFSQGGLVTIALAIHHDDVVGHALPIAGWLPPPLEPAYRRSDLSFPIVRSMHGTLDQIVPLEETRSLFSRLRDKEFDVELVEFEGVEHDVSTAMNALFRVWLEQAVCRAVDDAICLAAAIEREHALRHPMPDGGLFDADAGDAGDAGTDGGP
jgi:phospholipase/carboxylesterase